MNVHRPGSEAKSRAAVLSRQLQEEIVRRGLAEGDLFATELELCKTHSVSRSIVREAVSRLRTLGILRSVQRKGLVVCGGNPLGAFTRALPFFGRSSSTNLGQLAQLRYVLEVGAIELAVANRTPDQVDRLNELAEAFARADARFEVEEQNELDLQFHSVILEMTGNPMLAGMVGVLSEFFHTAYRKSPVIRSEPRAVVHHRAIANGIAQQNIELVRVVIRQHLCENLVIFQDQQASDALVIASNDVKRMDREAG